MRHEVFGGTQEMTLANLLFTLLALSCSWRRIVTSEMRRVPAWGRISAKSQPYTAVTWHSFVEENAV